VTLETLKQKLETLAEGTLVEVSDLTGTQDHYQAKVISGSFEGKSSLQRHRMVLALVQQEIDSGEIHALSLITQIP
jgi:stress-induced morphogen